MTNFRLTSRIFDLDDSRELTAFKYDLSFDIYTSFEQDLAASSSSVALSMGPVGTAGLIVLRTDNPITVSVCDAAEPFTVEDVMILAGVDVATELDVVAIDGARVQVFIAGA